jgi:hypothetical protein
LSSSPRRKTALGISLANGTIVSALCLALGTVAEFVRARYGSAWAERMSLASEALPGRILEMVGLLPAVRHQLVEGRWSVFQVRMLYATITVVAIFALALATGVLLWLVGWFWTRRMRATKESL